MKRLDLIKKLFQRCSGYIELRALPEGKQAFIALDKNWRRISKQIDDFCKKHKDQNLFFGVASRDGEKGTKENIIDIPCTWGDIDYKDILKPNFEKKLDKFFFKPTIRTESGKGTHLYFLLQGPVKKGRGKEIEKINQWIASELGGDNVKDFSRVLRLPDTINFKYPDKPSCEVVEIKSNIYTLDDFLEKIPSAFEKGQDEKTLRDLYGGTTEGHRNTDLTRLVGSWVRDKLTFDECFENARLWNTKNKPPLDEDEIKGVIKSILKKEEFVDTNNFTDVTDDSEEYINKIIPVYSFPFDVFPDKFQKVVKKEGIDLSVEPEVIVHTKIAIISGAIGNSIRISTKPNYKVPPFVWSGLVAPTGTGKSPAINSAMDHVEDLQAKIFKNYEDEFKKYNWQLSQAKKGKIVFPSNAIMPPPVFKQLKISDTTVEGLADVFLNQPRGAILHSDELSGLILSLNQYKHSKGSDKQHYLELFDAKPMMINRKTSGPKYVPNTGVAIIGGISPRILPKIFNTDSFYDGFLARFLYLHMEYNPSEYSRESLNTEDLSYWKSLVNFCYDIPLVLDENNRVKSRILTLNNSALDLWISFRNTYNQIAFFLPERIRGFIPKLITYSLKLAGILHILKGFEKGTIDNEIDEDTVHGAIKLTEFYAGQAVLLVQIYDIPVVELNGYQKRIIQVLYKLQHKVVGGELLLSEIVDAYNDSLHDSLKLSSEKISNILNKELGLTTKKCGANLSHLIWDQETIQELFKKTVTTVKDSEAHKGDAKPNTEPNNDGQDDMQETIENDLMEIEI